MANERPDYVPHGSARHAMLLGLRKAEKDEPLQHEGWTLIDPTVWGPMAREDFLLSQIKQRVAELKTKPEVPTTAPAMWVPAE